MSITFATKTVFRAVDAWQGMVATGKPIPPDLYRANSFFCPLGEAPGRGWVLMRRADLDDIDLNALHDAKFEEDTLLDGKPKTNAITLYNLVIASEPKCLTPGNAEDEDALYSVEIADARWRVHNRTYCVPINEQYNVRDPIGSGSYYADSTNGGTAWTWNGIVGDIWGLLTGILGTAPSLPITPDGTPEGFKFIGMSAWKALNQVLWRVGCTVKLNPTLETNPCTIVQIGATDTAFDNLLTANVGRKIHDIKPLAVVRGKMPYGVRVFRHKMPEQFGALETTQITASQFSTTSVYSEDIVGPSTVTAYAEAGLYHPLWDDLPALINAAGTITNAAALTTRATERKTDFFRMLETGGGERMHRIYSGIIAGTGAGQTLLPGSKCKGVVWREDLQAIGGMAGWYVTEIVRHPFAMMKVGDEGYWLEADEDSSVIRPPDYSPTFPIYPHLMQTIEVAVAAPTSSRYDCTVQRFDPSGAAPGTYTDRESVWGVDIGGGTGNLTVGDRYPARLAGYVSSRPCYLFFAAQKVGTSATHEILSATHTDTTAATVVRGDVITGQTATPKWTRLAKGTAKQVLAMNSGVTEPEWRSLRDLGGGGGELGAINPTGRWIYAGIGTVSVDSGNPLGNDFIMAVPMFESRGGTLSDVAIKVTAPGLGGSKARIGIYTNKSDTDLYPDAKIADFGEVAVDATGVKTISSLAQSLSSYVGQLLWLVCANDNSTSFTGYTGALSTAAHPITGGIDAFGVHYDSWGHDFTYAALPATFPDTTRTSQYGIIMIERKYSS